MREVIIHCQGDTEKFGMELAEDLAPGDVLALMGDLGAGKTTLTKYIAKGLGVTETVTSPTFTIVNEYIANDTNIYHFDVYRLADSDEFFAMGGLEYFENGISLIEWGNIIQDILPKRHIEITINKDNNNKNIRTLIFNTNSPDLEKILMEIFK